jgi:hypothetical protein
MTLRLATLGADVVWPSLVIPITLGLVNEWLIVRYGFHPSRKRAIVVDLIMNLASALVGAFLIWAAGLAWGFPIGALLYQYFRIGTFNPGFWIISLLFVVVVTTVIELSVIKSLCRIELNRDESQFC